MKDLSMQKELTYCEALREAQKDEMDLDPNVFLYGLDVGDHKSTFNSTKGLKAKFGEKRVFSTPLSEDALTGIGVGAAISGKKPVFIHIRADFLLLCMNQLANIAGNVRYYSKGRLQCPLTVRAIIGLRGFGQGAQHSKEIFPMFKYIPGVKVILPMNPQEAYSGLRAAIQSSDPVICFEYRYLYNMRGTVDTETEMALENWKHLWCPYPPVPTTKPLEDEWLKMRFGKVPYQPEDITLGGSF